MEIIGIDNVADEMYRQAEGLHLSGCVMVALAKVANGEIEILDQTSATLLSRRITNPQKRKSEFIRKASLKMEARLKREMKEHNRPSEAKITDGIGILPMTNGLFFIATFAGTKSRRKFSHDKIVENGLNLQTLAYVVGPIVHIESSWVASKARSVVARPVSANSLPLGL